MITPDFRKKMADSWFSYLQIQICKSFELLENNKLKFSKRDWCKKNIKEGLKPHGYEEGREYVVIKVPNITDISYGRGVGYTFTEHALGAKLHKISATNIRKEMRQKGELKEK